MYYTETKLGWAYRVDYNYLVDYDSKKLNKILEKLKEYKFIKKDKISFKKNKSLFSTSDKANKKKVTSIFYEQQEHANDVIQPNSIVCVVDGNNDSIVAEYSYEKLPDLYDYLDIIVNHKDIAIYHRLFGRNIRGRIDMSYAIKNKDKVLINALFNYIDSVELNDEVENIDVSVSKGLYELYKEALMCFNFELDNIKEYQFNQEPISGLTFGKELYHGGLELVLKKSQ